MAWAVNADLASSALTADLQFFFVIGGSDAATGRNLVTDSVYTVEKSASYGSDELGVYGEVTGGATGYLRITTGPAVINFSSGDFTIAVVFTQRSATLPAWASVFKITSDSGSNISQIQRVASTNGIVVRAATYNETTYSLAGITLDTEWTLIIKRASGTTKFFYPGGSTTLTAQTPVAAQIQQIMLGNETTLFSGSYPARFRAFGYWDAALLDSDCEAVIANPQGTLLAGAIPDAPTGVTAGSVTALSAIASWTDASADETGFKVEYAPSPYSSWTALSGSPTAANATSLATGNVLAPGTTYKFRVASTNANGDSAWVESNEFTTVGVGSGRMLLLGVG
jgi:hypothetical protein